MGYHKDIIHKGKVVGTEWVDTPEEEAAMLAAMPTHRRVMNAQAFMLLLTGTEFDAFMTSTDPLLVTIAKRFEMRNGEVNTESDIFKEVMDAAVSAGILTQERADELKLGKPI